MQMFKKQIKEQTLKKIFRHPLLVTSVVLTIVGSAVKVSAAPDNIFSPHLDRIQSELPPGYVMRLPSQVLLGGPVVLEPEELIVKVIPSTVPAGMTVSLFTCEMGPQPCLVGSFAVDSSTSMNAQRELSRHQAMAAPITLAPGVQGYLLEGPNEAPSSPFSSVMWQQDGMVYRVSFLAHERQNILNMAHSMAIEAPIRRAVLGARRSGGES